MKVINKLTAISSTASLFLFTTTQVFAAAPNVPISGAPIVPGQSPIIGVDSNQLTISNIIQYIVIILVAIGVIGALIFLIWGAVKWIISGGDKEKVEAARKQIIAAIIGLVILLLAVVILSAVIRFLGAGQDVFHIYVPSFKCWFDTAACNSGL